MTQLPSDSQEFVSATEIKAEDDLRALVKGVWWWVLIRGIFAIIFGVVALFLPGAALVAVAIVVGAYALVDGIMTVAQALRHRGVKGWGWLLTSGILTAIAGIVTLIVPGLVGEFGALVLLWTIVIWNIITGVMTLSSLSGLQGGTRTWGIISGIVSIIFGVVIGVIVLVNPASAILAFIWVTGLWAIIFGLALVVGAIVVRSQGKQIVESIKGI